MVSVVRYAQTCFSLDCVRWIAIACICSMTTSHLNGLIARPSASRPIAITCKSVFRPLGPSRASRAVT